MKEEIRGAMGRALAELAQRAGLEGGDLVVIGCSTSEVLGQTIGSASSLEIGETLVAATLAFCGDRYAPVFQCCEHLNRAVVVEKAVALAHGFCRVQVLPTPEAGGSLAAAAMKLLEHPLVVEDIAAKARAGIDIGGTLVGMHIQPVVVPVRLKTASIGKATIICARSRPKLIGGRRAVYPDW